MLGVIGGIIGVTLGWLGTAAITQQLGWVMVVSREAVYAAVGVALGASLLFGYYPAHRASSLDPIDALRTET